MIYPGGWLSGVCAAPAFLGAGGDRRGVRGWLVWGSGAGSGGGVVGLILGVFERCCVSVGFAIRLVLGWFRGLCTMVFLSASNVM